MSSLQWIFLIVGGITLLAAAMVVLSPKILHAALWLILALAGVAGLFLLLNAGFLAVVQVAVYIDAIAILIIIVVMLTRHVMGDAERQVNRGWLVGALVAVLIMGGLLAIVRLAPSTGMVTTPLAADSETFLQDLGRSLVDVDRYILPFEVASVLLLAALIGALLIARPPVRASEEEQG
jgi:NADH-quinone oxidoreductase subunit J